MKVLKTLDDGSKEKQLAIDDLNTLYRLKIDETRMGLELERRKERTTRDGKYSAV